MEGTNIDLGKRLIGESSDEGAARWTRVNRRAFSDARYLVC